MAEFPALYLWTDAFIADLTHLDNEEVGVYLKLLIFAWRTRDCSIPDDDFRLRNITSLSPKKWAKMRPVMAQFFQIADGVWRQKKLTAERDFVERLSARGRAGAEARWRGKSRKSNNTGDAQASDKHMPNGYETDGPHPHPHSIEDPAPHHARDALTFREKLLAAMGVDRSGLTGRGGTMIGSQADMAEADRWQQMPLMTEDAIAAEVRAVMAKKKDGPPSNFRYFTPAMVALSAALAAPPLKPEGGSDGPRRAKGTGRDAESLSRVIRRAIDQRGEDGD